MNSHPKITPAQLAAMEAEGWVVAASLKGPEGEAMLLQRGEEELFVMVVMDSDAGGRPSSGAPRTVPAAEIKRFLAKLGPVRPQPKLIMRAARQIRRPLPSWVRDTDPIGLLSRQQVVDAARRCTLGALETLWGRHGFSPAVSAVTHPKIVSALVDELTRLAYRAITWEMRSAPTTRPAPKLKRA